jgi:hypothetical protein
MACRERERPEYIAATRHRGLSLSASTEKYLMVPKTHEFADIVDLLLPTGAALSQLRRKANYLTQYAVDYRFLGCRLE